MIPFCLSAFSDTLGHAWVMFRTSSHNHKSCFKQRSQNHLSLSLCSSTFPVAASLKPEQHYDSQHKRLMLLATPLILFISLPCFLLLNTRCRPTLHLTVAKRSSHHAVLIVINGNRTWVGCCKRRIFPSCIIKKRYSFSTPVGLCSCNSQLTDLFVTASSFSFLKILSLVTFTHVVYACRGFLPAFQSPDAGGE